MQKYDAMYIVSPTLDEEARKALIAEVSAVFTSRGAEVEAKEWGLRKLAYEIEDFKEGYYVDLTVSLEDVSAVAEFDRVCNIKEAIIRHIVVKLPKDVK